MGRVRLLDPHTVNQIAAGEVVERPASVVKELVENALDAGATAIDVELQDSGRTLIRISDNGCGMTEEDAIAALQRHATSKITSVDDLMSVWSLGFRGEALPSIASVSRMTLSTGVEDGDRLVLEIEGGQRREPRHTAGPRGTEIRVEDLFFNTPARLKFLKSDTTELGQAIDHVSRYAIAYPNVRFTMTHNGQNVFRTLGDGVMLSAIGEVWGKELARALAEIDLDVAGLHVKGYVSPPHITKANRTFQFLYVNRRPVRTRTLTAALDQAYRDLTPERRYPMVVMNLEVEPSRVDVNVSPTKSEVKFQHEGAAFEAIRVGIKSALMEHGMMPDAAAIARANEALASVQRPMFSPAEQVLDWRGTKEVKLPSVFDAAIEAQRPIEITQPESVPYSLEAPSLQVATDRYPFGELLEDLRVVGQVMRTFIIAETRRGMVVVDQHVAHERILYEYLCGLKGSTEIEQQPLLVPQTLHLDRRSAVLLREKVDELQKIGFDLEPFGGESYVVRAVPAAIRRKDPIKILNDLVDELVETSVSRKLVPTRDQIWITSACHMAVKAGDPLTLAEMEKLIIDLAETENPYLCPHGRPITATLSSEALLRMFKRT